jgi:5-methylcytosine-specific restriction enzyme B
MGNNEARNIIFFGPPGTGKSYIVNEKIEKYTDKKDHIIRTTFHPEYSYYDFVGQYKPVWALRK